MPFPLSRRGFLALLPLLVPSVARAGRVAQRVVRGAGDRPKHPEPRPGITAANVLATTALHDTAAGPVFDMVREMPQIADGIRCSCGCASTKGYYSLLSCYEAPGMAQHCRVCQDQAKLAHRLYKDGWSLDGIRRAIDAEFAE